MSHLRKLQLSFVLFVSWIAISSILLFYSGNRHFGSFASDLPWQAEALSFQDLGFTATGPVQLVHVFDEHCVCNTKALAHIDKLNNNNSLVGVGQHFITPATLSLSDFMLPATPAVLIFIDGQLKYAGPYASGVMCSVDESLIMPILKQQVILPGLWLNGESTTCRCART